jgi:hypothetical protein
LLTWHARKNKYKQAPRRVSTLFFTPIMATPVTFVLQLYPGDPRVVSYMIANDQLSDEDVAFLEAASRSGVSDSFEKLHAMCGGEKEIGPQAPYWVGETEVPDGACITRVFMLTMHY